MLIISKLQMVQLSDRKFCSSKLDFSWLACLLALCIVWIPLASKILLMMAGDSTHFLLFTHPCAYVSLCHNLDPYSLSSPQDADISVEDQVATNLFRAATADSSSMVVWFIMLHTITHNNIMLWCWYGTIL